MSTDLTTADLLDAAIRVATHAHAGQLDKAGNPYILHPLRVMGMVENLNEKIVAALHDVVEDSPITLDGLRAVFPEDIVIAVDHLTRRDGESYGDFIARTLANPIAKVVKRADIEDHLTGDITYLPDTLIDRYRKAATVLSA